MNQPSAEDQNQPPNIRKTPSGNETTEDIIKYFTDEALEKRRNEIIQEMNLYTGTATSGGKIGTITIPTASISLTQAGSNTPYTPSSDAQNIYKDMLKKGAIATRSINETQLTLSDIFKYIKETSKDTQGKPEIYADRIAAEIYKKGKYSKEEDTKQITDAVTTYLKFFETTGLLEKEVTSVGNFAKDTSPHYALNKKLLQQYIHANKQATSVGIDNMTTMEANEIFLNYLDKEMNEKWFRTEKAYN